MTSFNANNFINAIESLIAEDNETAINIKNFIKMSRQLKGDDYTRRYWAGQFKPFVEMAQNGGCKYMVANQKSALAVLGLNAFYIGGREWDLFKRFCSDVGRIASRA